MTSSSSTKITELKTKITDSERTLGQKQIQIEYLEALVEVPKEDLGVDLKKKVLLRNQRDDRKPKSTWV